ncbi:hypothetical protein GMRT_14895 [Giardia muris]|uniref:Uncharacterized protein n=1 Tax=Giardia muris TaxID=5742 RepID=A0A4Z1SMR5_GIAMU|nr:hypothetical protein GMRT_14895 [Giardia muris]|eukprot:TNJ27002.1 hypothetical protein GMRT_14895 [Giardia muris]
MTEPYSLFITLEAEVVALRAVPPNFQLVISRSVAIMDPTGRILRTTHLPLPAGAILIRGCFPDDDLLACVIEEQGTYYFGLIDLSSNFLVSSSPILSSCPADGSTFDSLVFQDTVLLLCCLEGTLYVWPSLGSPLPLPLDSYVTSVLKLDTDYVLCGTRNGTVLVLALQGCRVVRSYSPQQGFAVGSLPISPEYSLEMMNCTGVTGVPFLRAARTLFLEQTLNLGGQSETLPTGDSIIRLAYHPHERLIAAGSIAGTIFFYHFDIQTPIVYSVFQHTTLAAAHSGFLVGDDAGAIYHVALENISAIPMRIVVLKGRATLLASRVASLLTTPSMILVAGGRAVTGTQEILLQQNLEHMSIDALRSTLSLAIYPQLCQRMLKTYQTYCLQAHTAEGQQALRNALQTLACSFPSAPFCDAMFESAINGMINGVYELLTAYGTPHPLFEGMRTTKADRAQLHQYVYLFSRISGPDPVKEIMDIPTSSMGAPRFVQCVVLRLRTNVWAACHGLLSVGYYLDPICAQLQRYMAMVQRSDRLSDRLVELLHESGAPHSEVIALSNMLAGCA